MEDFWNTTYFEIGFLNICLCSSRLKHFHGSYLNLPNFQMEYFKDILKIFQTNIQASKYGSYYPICNCLTNGLGSFSTYSVGSWSLQVHSWESSICIDLILLFNVYFGGFSQINQSKNYRHHLHEPFEILNYNILTMFTMLVHQIGTFGLKPITKSQKGRQMLNIISQNQTFF